MVSALFLSLSLRRIGSALSLQPSCSLVRKKKIVQKQRGYSATILPREVLIGPQGTRGSCSGFGKFFMERMRIDTASNRESGRRSGWQTFKRGNLFLFRFVF